VSTRKATHAAQGFATEQQASCVAIATSDLSNQPSNGGTLMQIDSTPIWPLIRARHLLGSDEFQETDIIGISIVTKVEFTKSQKLGRFLKLWPRLYC
jgi:hypothetical protein